MIDLSADLLAAAGADVIGLAVIGADRNMQRKIGRLVEWLPAIGVDCCECMLLVGMEAELAALAAGQRDMIALAGVRGASPDIAQPMTASSIRDLSICGNLLSVALIAKASMSSGRVLRNTPRGALPTGVRLTATM